METDPKFWFLTEATAKSIGIGMKTEASGTENASKAMENVLMTVSDFLSALTTLSLQQGIFLADEPPHPSSSETLKTGLTDATSPPQ